MKKTISCKPITEIDLAFDGGEIVTLRFDVEAIMTLQSMDGGLTSIVDKNINMPELCAKIIYAGAFANTKDFTYEKAREIVSGLSFGTINEIINEFNEAMGASSNAVQSEYAKKMMAQFLQTLK